MLELEAVADLKVLLMGDAIIDEYVNVTPLGKSTKDSMISVQFNHKETFSGGVWAAAQHVRSFCKTVDIQTGTQLTINRRYIEEQPYLRKLFVVHEARRLGITRTQYDVRDYDLVIVTDFGHGAIGKDELNQLKEAKFVAANAQTNTSNYGFNMITKFQGIADFVVLDELEARLATHDKYSKIEEVIKVLGYPKIIVTQGYKGATGFDVETGEFTHLPAPSDKALDTMGAGDAFLAVAALYAAIGLPMDMLVRIGNAAGAAKVNIIGHRTAVTPKAMEAYL